MTLIVGSVAVRSLSVARREWPLRAVSDWDMGEYVAAAKEVMLLYASQKFDFVVMVNRFHHQLSLVACAVELDSPFRGLYRRLLPVVFAPDPKTRSASHLREILHESLDRNMPYRALIISDSPLPVDRLEIPVRGNGMRSVAAQSGSPRSLFYYLVEP